MTCCQKFPKNPTISFLLLPLIKTTQHGEFIHIQTNSLQYIGPKQLLLLFKSVDLFLLSAQAREWCTAGRHTQSHCRQSSASPQRLP